jgi:hypothetical protein
VYLIAISGRAQPKIAIKLIDRRAGLGEPSSGGLADAVCRAIDEAGSLGGFAEPRPQVLFTDVRTAPEGGEGQLLGQPLGAGGERLAKRREDRQIDDSARLLIPKLDRAILLNVLAAEPRRVANPKARVEQDRIDKPFERAERIDPLELREFCLALCLVAVLFVDARLLRLEALDPLTGIAVDVAR